MATLPDIDTTQVSYLSYWNATNHGVSDIAPDEALSDGSVTSYTLYDNGWEGKYALGNGREGTVRVKEDGWFVTYLDRSESYSTDNGGKTSYGPMDILNWTSKDSTPDTQKHRLERAINSLQSNLSNSGSITYNTSDVGLYWYPDSSATTSTFLGHYTTNTSSNTVGFSYTSGTTRYYHVMTGRDMYGSNDTIAYTNDAGTTISLTTSGTYGARDALANADFGSSGTEYTSDISTNNITDAFANHYNVSVWA